MLKINFHINPIMAETNDSISNSIYDPLRTVFPIVSKEAIDHMLKRRDRKPVRAVNQFLMNKGFHVFLGGELFRNYVTMGNKNYNDIDLLAVCDDEQTRFELVRELNPCSIETRYMLIKDISFHVENEFGGLEVAYMNLYGVNRFKLTPERIPLFKLKRSSIDLSLITISGFLRQGQTGRSEDQADLDITKGYKER
jgi:hypothetical protein